MIMYRKSCSEISKFTFKKLNSGVVLCGDPILSCSEGRINTGLPDVSKHGEMEGGWNCLDKSGLCQSSGYVSQ